MAQSQLPSPTSLQTTKLQFFLFISEPMEAAVLCLGVWDLLYEGRTKKEKRKVTSNLSFPLASSCIVDAWDVLWSLSPFTSLSSTCCRFLQRSFIMNSAVSWKWPRLGCTRMVVSVWITFGKVLMRGGRAITEARDSGEELHFSWTHLGCPELTVIT